jgi:FHS family L-fucose permease-like MFS transporter
VATNGLSHLILSDNLVKTDEAVNAMGAQEKQSYYTQIFESVKLPYILIGALLLVFATLFLITRFPAREKQGGTATFFNPFCYPRLSRSMAAQFFYVGAQVCVSSFFINYALHQGVELSASKFLLGGLLIAFMVGRYVGAFLMKKYEAAKLLTVFSLGSVLLSLVVVLAEGMAGVVSFFGIEFFMSIMYPTIFAIGIKGMGNHTEMASSYMVMMIIGGALVPLLLGVIADDFGSVQQGYSVPLFCFVAIFFYARKEWKLVGKAASGDISFSQVTPVTNKT